MICSVNLIERESVCVCVCVRENEILIVMVVHEIYK